MIRATASIAVRALLLATGLGLSARATFAAESLSLKGAIQTALAQHPSILASRLMVQVAEVSVRQAESNRMPMLSATSGLSHSSALGLPPGSAGINGYQTQLTVSQPLYNPQQIGDAHRLAVLAARSSEAADRQTVLTVAYTTANAYVELLMAQDLLAAAKLDVEQADKQVAIAQEQANGQVGTMYQVLSAQSTLAQAHDSYVRALDAFNQARQSLEAALGESLGDRTIDPAFALQNFSADAEQIARALENRPDLQGLEISREIQEASAEQAAHALLPTMSAVGGSSLPMAGGIQYSLGVTASWAMFDGGRSRMQGEAARLSAEQVQATLEARRLQARHQIMSALQSYRTAQQRVSITQQGLKTAIDTLEISRVRFEAGVGTSLEVINALTSLNSFQVSYVQARYGVIRAQLSLAQAMGISLTELLP
ncbi:Outer membrane efflux protein BepC precursor [compost metagenome]